jgi:hypothetical protein
VLGEPGLKLLGRPPDRVSVHALAGRNTTRGMSPERGGGLESRVDQHHPADLLGVFVAVQAHVLAADRVTDQDEGAGDAGPRQQLLEVAGDLLGRAPAEAWVAPGQPLRQAPGSGAAVRGQAGVRD